MLETVWFGIWGLLWAVYFVLDGFDLGLGALQPILARNEGDRRDIYLAMGPFWDANEVWLVAAGGVTFAAFPALYAVLFSSFYSVLMLILFALILRAVSVELGGETKGERGRSLWRGALAIGSLLAAFLFGVLFANIFRGIPIDGSGVYQGTFMTFLNPYALVGGLFFLGMFLLHGSLWLAVKANGSLQGRAGSAAAWLWTFTFLAAAVFLALSALRTDLFVRYLDRPVLLVIPLLAVGGMALIRFRIAKGAWSAAWWASCVSIIGVVAFGVVGLYPLMLPSSLDSASGLTAHTAAASPMTLKIMLGVVLVFVPIIALYQGWVYRLFGGKVDGNLYVKD